LVVKKWIHRYTQLTNRSSARPKAAGRSQAHATVLSVSCIGKIWNLCAKNY